MSFGNNLASFRTRSRSFRLASLSAPLPVASLTFALSHFWNCRSNANSRDLSMEFIADDMGRKVRIDPK